MKISKYTSLIYDHPIGINNRDEGSCAETEMWQDEIIELKEQTETALIHTVIRPIDEWAQPTHQSDDHNNIVI